MRWLTAVMLVGLLLIPIGGSGGGRLSGVAVIIDPGHGGTDLGTKRKFGNRLISESQLTWGVAKEWRRQLEVEGADVSLTTRASIPETEMVFGRDTIPDRGADYFNVFGQPPINSSRAGLEQRLNKANEVALTRNGDFILYVSLHFDHVMRGRDGYPPPGARIIHPAGVYDTLLVECLAAALADDGLLRGETEQPTIASGRGGLGKRLMVLRQAYDPRRLGTRRHPRLVYNHVQRSVLIELANLPSNADWERLQEAGALRRLARALTNGVCTYVDLSRTTDLR